ncbi:MAG: hypothetical protein OHK0013_16490 [Sandaracinaceae bacterium]
MSALDLLVASLPTWVRWGPSVAYPTLALGTIVPLTWLLEAWLLRPFRALPSEAHWSERARLGFPVRVRLVSWAFTATILVAMAWVLWLGRLTPVGVALAPVVACVVVTGIAVARTGRMVAPERPRLTARGLMGLVTLGWGAVLVLVAGVALSPPSFGVHAWTLAVVCAALVLAWSAGLPVRAAVAVGLFRDAPERVRGIVARCAARAGIPPPPTYIAELPTANAFALVVARRLVLTNALVAALDDEALEAVVDHEMSHLVEPRRMVVARLVSSIALVPLVLVRPTLATYGPWGIVALALLTGVVIVVAARMRRRLEHAADSHAHGADTERGQAYARVLERIYALNGIPAVMRSALGTHPSLYDRMIAAGAEPSFPRPAPPPRMLLPLVVCFSLAVVALLGTRIVLMWAEVAHGERLGVIHFVIATTGGDEHAIEQLGYARYLAGDVEGATKAYAAAAELAPDDAEPLALVARLRMMSGDCRGAVGAAWDASVVAERTGDPHDRALVRSVRRELERCEPR